MEPQGLISLVVALLGAGGLGAVIVAIVNGRFGAATEARKDIWVFVQNLRNELTEANAKIDALDSKVDSQRATIRQQEDTIAGHQRTIIDQGATIKRQDEELTRLRAQVAELQGRTYHGGLSDG